MGNAISPCFNPKISKSAPSTVKLIFWEGTTRTISGKHVAGEIMSGFPDKMVCHADSFFIGHHVPALSIDDDLSAGETYFVLPVDGKVLSASSLAALGSSPSRAPVEFGENPFQYVKGTDGRVVIKVTPEFITRLISRGNGKEKSGGDDGEYLCSTPELKKHYDRLVGTKVQIWSPKLETISEYKVRFSPCKCIRVGVEGE